MLRWAELVQLSRPFWAMAAILLLAIVAVPFAPPLPEGYQGLARAGPYAVLVPAVALAWWFNRGRVFVVAASLLAGWALYHYDPASKPVYTAITLFVPLNCLLAFAARERGSRHGGAYRWLALIAVEVALAVWLQKSGVAVEHWSLRSPPTPLIGRILFAAALAAAIWRAYPDFRPLQVAGAGAVGAFFIGMEWATSGGVVAGFTSAAAAMLVVALLQESHQLAFRDELTGLPGRRALDERLRGLRGRYALAMVDVDHFKKFNDTHGHDVGDQVLKLVAGRLAQVGGGGIAYRYGGEEFSVLFPDADVPEAVPHLEAIRRAIESYRMAVRGEDRPKNPDDSNRLRVNKPVQKTLAVTVSIGVSSPGGKRRSPAQVLKAADEALYRAKQSGRNRLSE
jgi:diguanylate cyclase (GGDEF)-like protein